MAKTKIIKIKEKEELKSQLKFAIKLINEGEIVAFPTETVYGLGADALNPNAVKKIFQAKGRPSDNPLIVHVSSKSMMNSLIDLQKFSKEAEKLIDCFFPGPLTLVLKKSELVPDIITAGLDTVAIRFPSNEIALNLIKFSNKPIAAPSANLSGKPSPTTAKDVFEDLHGKIKLIIDGGKTIIGLESTVIDVSINEQVPEILRLGKITKENIEECLGISVNYANIHDTNRKVKSPGMKYRHYAPNATLNSIKNSEEMLKALEKHKEKKISIIVSQTVYKEILNIKLLENLNNSHIYVYNSTQELGMNLFSKLRELDRLKVDIILIQYSDNSSYGKAILNRIQKAASD